MSETRGIFGLNDLIDLEIYDEWVNLQEVWISPSPFISYSPDTAPDTGYFGGGRTPSPTSTMDKVTYASDTTAAVPGAALSSTRRYHAATGNQTAGYFGGGEVNDNNTTSVDKVTYADDTTAAVPGANTKHWLFWWWCWPFCVFCDG